MTRRNVLRGLILLGWIVVAFGAGAVRSSAEEAWKWCKYTHCGPLQEPCWLCGGGQETTCRYHANCQPQ